MVEVSLELQQVPTTRVRLRGYLYVRGEGHMGTSRRSRVSRQCWLDKVRIDQRNIFDLQCLPIFLAGCDRLLVTKRLNVHVRLWCRLELFIYMQMYVEADMFIGQALVLTLNSGTT